jgi:murein L,D-transpeptidase YafK
MMSRYTSAALLAAALLAGCSGSLEDIAPKAERQLPQQIVQTMKAKGMSKGSPIMMRVFKEEGVLEVWKQTQSGRYDLVTSYEICKWSGKLGPKFTEGDRQAPEGFYAIRPHQMNPQSSYHLAFNIGFPNNYDRANGRSGTHLMVHGACSSAGCYSMSDEQVEQIYAFARDAFRGGQEAFQFQAYPFRLTPENMARYRSDPNYPFWEMLKEGYDHFEITRKPPKVDICDRRYVFNRVAAEGHSFVPAEACPPSSQPPALVAAYQAYKKKQEMEFGKAAGKKPKSGPRPSIVGLEEARLVADWSRRRARGERVSPEPPSLSPVMVAGTSAPASTPVPVNAYAAAPAGQISTGTVPSAEAGAVSERQIAVGAPPVGTGTLPVPSPNPNQEEAGSAAEAAPAPVAPAPTRSARIWNLFRN